jgi:hypothetical protein
MVEVEEKTVDGKRVRPWLRALAANLVRVWLTMPPPAGDLEEQDAQIDRLGQATPGLSGCTREGNGHESPSVVE